MIFEDAEKLLAKYVSGASLVRHCRQVSAAMRHFARKFGEDEDFWAAVGLLHDIDFEKYPDEHCAKAAEIFAAEKAEFPWISDEFVRAVQCHAWQICFDVEPVARMEKVLYASDSLTGLVFATAMSHPSKSAADLETKSVVKKFKSKSFAAAVNREAISRGAEMLGMELSELVGETILAMRENEKLG